MNFKVIRDASGTEQIVQFEIDLFYGNAHLETPKKLTYNDILELRKWIDLLEGSELHENEDIDAATIPRPTR